jgi:glycosyltransferase involved in cell wall biosynthesis/MoaA/NifB/PqqE/SkfB family radical SAM enzyme/GT2 family glycosyltransferase
LHHLKQTLEALKRNTLAHKSDLYIFSDAPKQGDEEKVAKVRNYIHTIDGFKTVNIIERTTNSKINNVRGGIRELLDKYGRIIFMEDDIVTARGFLQFMNDALNFFENDKKIIAISGYNVPANFPTSYKYDYYLSHYFNGYGYATWDDRGFMEALGYNGAYNEVMNDSSLLKKIYKVHPKLINGLKQIQEGKLDAGDYKIVFHSIKNSLYTIKPIHSFVNNIGHDGSGVHCGKSKKFTMPISLNQKKVSFFKRVNYEFKIDQIFYDYFHPQPSREAKTNLSVMLPETLNFMANDVCNSRCKMCRVWDQKRGKEITPEEFSSVVSDPLFRNLRYVGVSGGEPTLRRDLPEIFRVISCKDGIKGAGLITNALIAEHVIKQVTRCNEVCMEANLPFNVMVSLDGIGKVHDAVRGRQGAFKNALKVIRHIRDNTNIALSIGCTAIKQNVWHLDEVLDLCKREKVYGKFRIGEFINRLYNRDLKECIRNFNNDERYQIALFFSKLELYYETSPDVKATYRNIRQMIFEGKPRKSGCPYRSEALGLDSKGNLLFCSPKSPDLGSCLEKSATEIYLESNPLRESIIQRHCSNCIHDYHATPSKESLEEFALETLSKQEMSVRQSIINSTTLPNASPATLRWSKLKKPLIIGWYGTETVGDKAIIGDIIRRLKNANRQTQITIASLFPFITSRTLYEIGTDNIRIVKTYSREYLDACKSADAIVMGGGPLMGMEPLGFVLTAFSEARKADIPCIIEGCGIGPLTEDEHILAVKEILRLSTQIRIRDKASCSWVSENTGRADAICSGDPAAFFVEAWKNETVQVQKIHKKEYFACFLREITFEYANGKSSTDFLAFRELFEKELGALIRKIREKTGLKPLLMPMHTFAVGQDDRDFARRFAETYLQDDDYDIGNKVYSPQDILSVMSRSKFNVCMRFHSVLFAEKLDVPFVAIDYTGGGKIKGFLKDQKKLQFMFDRTEISNENWRQKIDAILLKYDLGSLNVVHLCSLDYGGAGKAAYRLHKGLQAIGVDSTMLVLNKRSGDPSVKVLPADYSKGMTNCLDVSVYNSSVWNQQTGRWGMLMSNYPNRPAGLEMFADANSDVRLDLVKEIREADVINLHWVAGLMDYNRALFALRGKSIVWTLHDMNPFTGGCHYAGDCKKYIEGCWACPQLGSDTKNDLSHHVWKQKNDVYKFLNINIVTPSRWLDQCVAESKLLSRFPANVIPNGFPFDIFKPYPKEEARKILNVPESVKVIMFGADYIVNERKGFKYLLNALNKFNLKNRQNNIILTFGHLPESVKITSKYPVYNLGPIEDENQLAVAYSAADVFVIPSLEDNLPNTVVEAMACGVPVVGFDIGGIPDVVVHKKTGFLVKPKNIAGLIEGIDWVLSSSDSGRNFSEQCRKKVEKKYAFEEQAKTYYELYSRISKNHLKKDNDEILRYTSTLFNFFPKRYTSPTIATSIAPRGIDLQKRVIQNWVDLGFQIISVNSSEEIQTISNAFPEVDFVLAKRDAKEMLGKPFVFLDDVLIHLRSIDSEIIGIVNSDIFFTKNKHFLPFIQNEAKNFLVYGSRVEVDCLDSLQGEIYNKGFDFFFFPKAWLDDFPKSRFCIGATWWDYWLPLIIYLAGHKSKKLVSPTAYHLKHSNKWDQAQWLSMGSQFYEYFCKKYLKQEFIQKENSIYGDFAEIFPHPTLEGVFGNIHHSGENALRLQSFLHTFALSVLQFLEKHTCLIKFEGKQLYTNAAYQKDIHPKQNSAPLKTVSAYQPIVSNDYSQKKSAKYLVTAIVSTYNSERFIRGCLEDLEAQTIADKLEIIVVNSGSEQDEQNIVKKFQQKYANIKYIITDQRESLYQAWNRGIEASCGKYITNANTDDSHRPDALEKLANALETHPETDLAYAHCAWTSKPNDTFENPHEYRKVIYPPFNPALSMFFCFLGPHPMWRRTVFEKIGLFDAKLKAAGDYEFQMRFTAAGRKAVLVPEILSLFYQNPNGLTFQSKTSHHEVQEIYKKYRRIIPITNLYSVDISKKIDLAKAWIAQGNLALNFQAPWEKQTQSDLAYAYFCYQEAIKHAPNFYPVVHNMILLLGFLEKWRDCEQLIKSIPDDQAGVFRDAFRGRNPLNCIRDVNVPLRLEPIVYKAPRQNINRHPASSVDASDSFNTKSDYINQVTRPSLQKGKIKLKWGEAIFSFSGYSRLSRDSILSLDHKGVALELEPFSNDHKFIAQLKENPNEYQTWQRLLNQHIDHGCFICFHPPTLWDGTDWYAHHRRRNPAAKKYIGITMFETDRLPEGWAEACNAMDEVWVPSTFNRETFVEAGVDSQKLHVIPFGLKTAAYDPEKTTPLAIPGRRNFAFLSVFQWSERKGWDILLKAYLSAFSASDDVCLVLRTYPDRVKNPHIGERINAYTGQLRLNPDDIPPIILLEDFIPESNMPSLYAAADAFVLPTRGEGWGIPYMEAMAMGLPVIGTRWGASLDFMNDANSYLLDVDQLVPVALDQTVENPFYGPDHQWAEPSVEHTATLMRQVYENQNEAKVKGKQACQDVHNKWDIDRTAEWIINRVAHPQQLQKPTRRGNKTLPAHWQTLSCTPSVSWHAPIYDPSGYADEARNFLINLELQGVNLSAQSIGRYSETFRSQMEVYNQQLLDRMQARRPATDFISVVHFPAYAFKRVSGASYHIGRTMFETDGLPTEWVEKCNQMDEIWVPTDFNLNTFRRAGVRAKLVKVPGGIDTEKYRPGYRPLQIPGLRRTVFLSIFEWIYRKGWDVLLRAWGRAFTADDDVSLVIRGYPINLTEGADEKQEIEARINNFLRAELGVERNAVAPIIVLGQQVPENDMPRLYASANALVAPSRGEGWGRPQMEAMACGLPVIATRWSGNLEFMHDQNSYLIDIEGLVAIDDRTEIPFYRGQNWAEPSVEHLATLFRKVVEQPNERQLIGHRARSDMEANWQWRKTAGIAADRLRNIGPIQVNAIANISRKPKIPLRWEGSQFVYHSLALVNRELCIELARREEIELSLIPYEPHQFTSKEQPDRLNLIENCLNKSLSASAEFHIRHQWPPNFRAPAQGHWIMMQPWEFGALPIDWIEPLKSEVDEIWVYTDYVRNVYINSGIPASKVQVIPLGVNYNEFHCEAPKLELNTGKKFKFLFVGGTLWRKGIDVLLEAYTKAFSNSDGVCLVIKDIGAESFYKGKGASDQITAFKERRDSPEIIYYSENLKCSQIAGLYTACNCLVHSYRGEGFGLPVAEAMACGLPVVVTKGGACDDFCSTENAYLIASSRRPIQLEGFQLVNQGWVLEPDKDELVRMLRYIYENANEAAAKGRTAARDIRNKVSWKVSADAIVERVSALRQKPIIRFQNQNKHSNREVMT